MLRALASSVSGLHSWAFLRGVLCRQACAHSTRLHPPLWCRGLSHCFGSHLALKAMTLLTKKQACQKAGLNRASIDRFRSDPRYHPAQFPKPVQIGCKVLWSDDELDDWIGAQLNKRQSPRGKNGRVPISPVCLTARWMWRVAGFCFNSKRIALWDSIMLTERPLVTQIVWRVV